jgi:hypothetical protein
VFSIRVNKGFLFFSWLHETNSTKTIMKKNIIPAFIEIIKSGYSNLFYLTHTKNKEAILKWLL